MRAQVTRLRVWPLLLVLGVFGGGLIAAAAVLATHDDGGPAVAGGHKVMPGHGMVMPTDVKAVARHGEMKVMVGDYWLKSSAHRMHAGAYTFIAQNVGVIPHDVMIEKVPIKMAGGEPVDEAAPYGVDGLLNGTTKRTRVVLDAGTWELFCSVPGHYQAGQHMKIEVYGRLPMGTHMPKNSMMDDGEGDGGAMGPDAMGA